MADGIAPAIDKVGAPEPAPPEVKVGTPAADGALRPASSQPGEPAANASAVPKPVEVASAVPKPVEVASASETPVNGATPAGGTPRPELKIALEPSSTSKEPAAAVAAEATKEPRAAADTGALPNSTAEPDTTVIKAAAANGATKKAASTLDSGSEQAVMPAASAPGAASTPKPSEPAAAAGDKRKLGKGATEKDPLPSEKKAKVDVAGAQANGGRKVGRPKKVNKAATAQVGKTARKTRSQGPAEV